MRQGVDMNEIYIYAAVLFSYFIKYKYLLYVSSMGIVIMNRIQLHTSEKCKETNNTQNTPTDVSTNL
jgi:hypothetical protein